MMTKLLPGDLSHTPHPAFYITDTDFCVCMCLVGGGGCISSLGGGMVCNRMCVGV